MLRLDDAMSSVVFESGVAMVYNVEVGGCCTVTYVLFWFLVMWGWHGGEFGRSQLVV